MLTTRSFAPLPNGQTQRSYYYFNSQRVAMREVDAAGEDVLYLLGDHLGSTSLVLCGNPNGCAGVAYGGKVAESRYYPYGEERWHWPEEGTLPTDYRFTGARQEAGLGIYIMGARWYDSALARWLSADTLVPGTAASSGGGAATLGYDDQARLTPLTVGFHETQFLSGVGEENREIAAKGKIESKYQWGPSNPQALNRYAYCLGNPLRYTDPTGHQGREIWRQELTHGAWNVYSAMMSQRINQLSNRAKWWGIGAGLAVGVVCEVAIVAGTLGIGAVPRAVVSVAAGGVAGAAAYEIAGGAEAGTLQGLLDYLSIAQAKAENAGKETITIIA
jgi:RHS repeat-associated protein